MAIFRCKMCGGDIDVQEGNSSCICEFCGTQQTLPKVQDENLQGLFNRANVLRMKAEFDKAADNMEKEWQSLLKNLRNSLDSCSEDDLRERIAHLEETKSFFENIPE